MRKRESMDKCSEPEGEQIALETRQQQPLPEGWLNKWQNRQAAIEDRWRNYEYGD